MRKYQQSIKRHQRRQTDAMAETPVQTQTEQILAGQAVLNQEEVKQPAAAAELPNPTSAEAVYKVIKPMQNLRVSHNEHFKVESAALLADVASTSNGTFGNFILSSGGPTGEESQQVAFLRSLNSIELFKRSGSDGSLELVTTYKMPNVNCISMEKITIDVRQSIFESASQVVTETRRGAAKRGGNHGDAADGIYEGAALGEDSFGEEDDYMDVRTKDLLVIHMPELKFLVLEFDNSTCEFGTYCLFNFDQSEELKVTGKRFPKQGKLRSLSSIGLTGFSFLADDTLFCWVQFRDATNASAPGADSTGKAPQQGILKHKSANSAHAKKAAALELTKRQSSQMWPGDDDEFHPTTGVVSQIQLSERYMNAMSGDPSRVAIESLVKPLEVFQLDKFGIQFIEDVQLVEQKSSQTVSVLVLYKGNIAMIVGTKARYQVTRLAIFQFNQGASSSENAEESKIPGGQDSQSQILKYVMTIDTLPFYANKILLPASTSDDFCYLLTPYSFCLVRHESNRVTEVFTSTLGQTIREKQYMKDDNKQFHPQESATERSLLEDQAGQELKLDGMCRLMPLPGRRILILTEKGSFVMLAIRYDQAEIYIAEVNFQPLQNEYKLVGSSLCFSPSSPGDENSIDIFVTSHFHDASLFRLKTVTDPEKIAQLTEEHQNDSNTAEKRQRLNSSEHILARRRKNQTFYEPLALLDSLPIVSPVSDSVQIPSIAGVEAKGPSETSYSMDFLIGSGNQVKSYLTFAAASIPLINSQMSLSDLVPTAAISSRLKVLRVMTFKDQYIIINYKADQHAEAKTSIVHIDVKTKKLVQLSSEQMDVNFDAKTIACYSLSTSTGQEAMVQVCPQTVTVVTTAEPRELLARIDQLSVKVAAMDPLTQTLFTMEALPQSHQHCKFVARARRGTNLEPQYDAQLNAIKSSITAMSVATVPQVEAGASVNDTCNLLVIATETSDVLIYEIKESHLSLVFQSSEMSQQFAILPNQMSRVGYESLKQRTFTDTSVDMVNCYAASSGQLAENINQAGTDARLYGGAAQMSANGPLSNSVRELKLWFPEQAPNRPVLIAMMSDATIMVYQNMACFEGQARERFRFKLVDSHVLIRPKTTTPLDQSYSRQFIHIENKMALVLHPAKALGIFMRHCRPVLIDIGKQQGVNLVDLAPFRTGFLAIDEDQTSVRSVKFAPRFDPRVPTLKLTDGYLLKQFTFKDRGIKKIKLFSPNVVSTNPADNPDLDPEQLQASRDYIFLATYRHKTPDKAAVGQDDFAPEMRAPSMFYTIEVLRLPKSGGQWSEYREQFLFDKVIKYNNFQESDVINQLEQITLRSSTTNELRNYMAVASMRIDTSLKRRVNQRQDDEGFYSSALHIFKLNTEKTELETCFAENYKRSITCISSYLGNLIATMKNLKLQDLVFIMYKFDSKERKLVSPQPIPNGVQNLATSISFDGDFIIIGDAYKNLNLLKKCDEEDNKQERQESSGLINFKKVMSNKIDANVIGAYSLNKKLALTQLDQAIYCQNGVMSHHQVIPLTEIQKKLFTVMGASFDGYVRLYKIKETKNLEIVAQINVMDKIMNTIPLELNSFKKAEGQETAAGETATQQYSYAQRQELLLASTQERKIALVTQRNGIQVVSSCSEIEYRAQKSLMELMSKVVPSRGCITPMHSHLTPTTVYSEKSSVYQRTNQNAINYSKSLYLYWFLNETQKEHIASKIGFTVAKLESFLISQRFNVKESQPPVALQDCSV